MKAPSAQYRQSPHDDECAANEVGDNHAGSGPKDHGGAHGGGCNKVPESSLNLLCEGAGTCSAVPKQRQHFVELSTGMHQVNTANSSDVRTPGRRTNATLEKGSDFSLL
eukprot:s765_g8.t1